MEISTGQIVRSMSGRDKGRYFVVLETNGEFVILADGKMRKLEHPKQKKLKHVQVTKSVVAETQILTNKQLRSVLFPFNYGDTDA